MRYIHEEERYRKNEAGIESRVAQSISAYSHWEILNFACKDKRKGEISERVRRRKSLARACPALLG